MRESGDDQFTKLLAKNKHHFLHLETDNSRGRIRDRPEEVGRNGPALMSR
jgi:hypothetical protein